MEGWYVKALNAYVVSGSKPELAPSRSRYIIMFFFTWGRFSFLPLGSGSPLTVPRRIVYKCTKGHTTTQHTRYSTYDPPVSHKCSHNVRSASYRGKFNFRFFFKFDGIFISFGAGEEGEVFEKKPVPNAFLFNASGLQASWNGRYVRGLHAHREPV